MLAMYDNLTLEKECRPSIDLLKANGRPFEHRGIIFHPKFQQGKVCRYDGRLKNLLLFWKPEGIKVCNSIHKYWHGNNFTDFHLWEMGTAIEKLSDETGISWKGAVVKYLEYGCNVGANATTVYRGLQSYQGKDYSAMDYRGKVYGARRILTDYTIKGYDKTLQAKLLDGISLDRSLFRWEVAVSRTRGIEKLLGVPKLTLRHLLMMKTGRVLADDALQKYQTSIKMQQLDLSNVSSPHVLRIIAYMQVHAIRDEIKRHYKETFDRDRKIYSRIMADKSVCIVDDTEEQMRAKFSLLINNRGI
jgi:hypothetical protein